MKFLQNCSFLAVLVAFSNAISIPSRLRSEEHHQISTAEDIPELPEGFTWRIVEHPVGIDTRISRVVELETQSNQLQKRAFAIGCVGHPGSPPLIDDCNTLNTQVQNYQSTLLVQPGYCHEATYGTCLTYVCAKCRQVAMDTNKWYDLNQAVISHCVDNGEAGYGYDNTDNEYEIGIEHSGDELPSYIC
ncbi:hypothetical protein BDV25DRAFT_143858 [Aspergillus avenaceus]|uniref:Cyanovirin-N domain-containing protein n=1 Tax=Aspergillus avenaceus TaxID=36643 RepID=A0A5N6TIV5_ASPAV|nr:hypothetical protein BDV25DRAFT_143858 [Aspergillus avenaceus]